VKIKETERSKNPKVARNKKRGKFRGGESVGCQRLVGKLVETGKLSSKL